MHGAALRGILIAVFVAAITPFASAQQEANGPPGIALLNQERLFNQSLYGQRLQSELEAASAELAAENREIEARLTAEELELTELRSETDPETFRALADEFDQRVTAIRSEQVAKARELQSRFETAPQRFFEDTFDILLEVLEAQGAAVLLDSRSVLLAVDRIDITDDAIEAIDAALGDGGAVPAPDAP